MKYIIWNFRNRRKCRCATKWNGCRNGHGHESDGYRRQSLIENMNYHEKFKNTLKIKI